MIDDNTTSVFEEGKLITNPSTDDAIQFVAAGVWEDPRTTVTGRMTDKFGAKTNAKGRMQSSIRATLDDGNPILISAFDGKINMLDGLKLGYTYTFKGKLKTKTEVIQNKEETSRFLNL
jgi:hypothetical protein